MKTLKIGVVGLGRLGIKHCENLLTTISAAEVTAACSIVPDELDKARALGIASVFDSYETMLAQADIDALVLSTSTDRHAEQIIAGLESGRHVFCEKPLGLSVKECEPVLETAARHTDLITMIGFVRRFDVSYMDAYRRIQDGQIGSVYRVHSQTSDWTEFAEFQVKFSQTSGGIFHDYNIHDIDLVHWLSGAKFSSVYAVGGAYKYPAFGEMGGADNTICLATLDNGGFATLSAGRTEAHGHGTHTIVYGTEGTLAIGIEPAQNRVQIFDQHGVRQECAKTFYDRFEDAFIEELRSFVDGALRGKPSPVLLSDALEATRVACAMTDSFEKKTKITL